MDAFFFWLFSLVMLGCGLGVILNRNPVASAICFAFCIFFMSGLFILLSAFFLAAVQILVTAGAVMVLFLFIIMLLDLSGAEKVPKQRVWMGASLVLALAFVYLVARTLSAMPEGYVKADSVPENLQYRVIPPGETIEQTYRHNDHFVVYGGIDVGIKQEDDTHQIGHLLFTKYLAPFEVTSLLILVATIGVIVLCKQEERT